MHTVSKTIILSKLSYVSGIVFIVYYGSISQVLSTIVVHLKKLRETIPVELIIIVSQYRYW